MLTENKYYEANLALKKAEGSWVIDSQSFVDYLVASPKADQSMISATNSYQSDAPKAAGSNSAVHNSGNKPSLICFKRSREAICKSWPGVEITIPASCRRRSVLENVSLVRLS